MVMMRAVLSASLLGLVMGSPVVAVEPPGQGVDFAGALAYGVVQNGAAFDAEILAEHAMRGAEQMLEEVFMALA